MPESFLHTTANDFREIIETTALELRGGLNAVPEKAQLQRS